MAFVNGTFTLVQEPGKNINSLLRSSYFRKHKCWCFDYSQTMCYTLYRIRVKFVQEICGRNGEMVKIQITEFSVILINLIIYNNNHLICLIFYEQHKSSYQKLIALDNTKELRYLKNQCFSIVALQFFEWTYAFQLLCSRLWWCFRSNLEKMGEC